MISSRQTRLVLFVAGVLALAAAAGCSSNPEPGPPPQISSATAERDVVNGLASLKSTVTVQFDRPFELAPSRVPLASHFEFDVPLAVGGSRRVLVATAERPEDDSRSIVLKVDTLIPDGATLKVARRAFDAEAAGEMEVTVEGDLNPALVLLATTELQVSDPAFYDAPVIAEVTEEDRDAVAQREALEFHLNQRQVDPQTYLDALAIYDAISVDIVASPKLRAALAALTGTFAEPALASLLTEENCTGLPAARIAFETPPGGPELIARVTYVGSGARVISVNTFAEGERIEHLMPILAHEAVHCDGLDGRTEELAATAFDGLLYLNLVAADPELARSRTRVARELNIDAVALINSGGRLPESIGVLPSPGVTQILPGTNSPYGSFAEFIVAAYPQIDLATSPTEPLAQAYADILAQTAGMDAGDPFSIRYLDELLGRAIHPAVLVAAIQAFGLAPAS
ncbi:MAG: hypothetical protein M9925_08615 [Chloroflexi bacterium]|nr:hypothetical protein [Chloroflexota bacterium]